MTRALPVLLLVLVGCTSSLPAVRGLHDTLRDRIHEAKYLGAMECSPKELATAQAAYRFATTDLNRGQLERAEQHLTDGLAAAARAQEAGLHCNARGLVPDKATDPWMDQDGDGVVDDQDDCPWAIEDVDEYLDTDGCPEPDDDGDGILDREDTCPREAEDRDGFEDSDGCPELDNDNDGVSDDLDQCPNHPETKNGFDDEDGCPDFRPEHLTVEADALVLNKPLVFVDDADILLAQSHAPLREVATLLGTSPDVALRIEGHTDNRGDAAVLLKLSQARALAVRDFLVKEGVAADRLEAEGFGDTQPISTNRTAPGRKLNNRVTFHVTRGSFQ